MVRTIKVLALEAARSLGVTRLAMRSRWRRERLLILCYHGTSIEDEHRWNPSLYITQEQLRRRLELVRRAECNVLPLGEAVERLYRGDLPPRSVAITYDDGAYDFYRQAFPVLEEFGFPVTLYLTTYYATHPGPVYDTMSSYLAWKARGRELRWPEVLGGETLRLDAAGVERARRRLWLFPQETGMSGGEKAAMLAELAERLGIDYAPILEKRILQLITMAEAGELARKGVDLQLHTHRHGVSMKKEVFAREIRDNRLVVEPLRGSPAAHFCYPSGIYRPEFVGWLKEWKMASATTCDPGMAWAGSERMLLPRLVDTGTLTETEFVSWLSGLAARLPHRAYAEGEGRFLE